ncbi:MAG TPA: hypothetical protein VKX49_15720 [Bryobacteraceae bacterium]|nr:hypothetical protein [Bryobacteraceae bacterium]
MSGIPYAGQSSALLNRARSATPFTSQDGQPCASVPGEGGSRHVYPLRSADFRDWLICEFVTVYEAPPSQDAFRAVLRTLEARAAHAEYPPQKLDYRVGFEGDPFAPSKIILDLANAQGHVLEIDAHGWRVRENFDHPCRQSLTTLPLPAPTLPPADGSAPAMGALDRFAELFSLSALDCAAISAWLVNALRPKGPYPILVLEGRPCSGKTLLARALHFLLDPSPALTRRLPDEDREMLRLAYEHWILAFDDIHRVPLKMSDALCALSQGAALRLRQADSRDALEFQIARPMILIVPYDESNPGWTPPRALSNRTVTVRRLPIQRMRPESAIWSDFQALHPSLLAQLAQAAATALRRIREVEVPNVARFPDAAMWSAAAAPALGLTEQIAIDALSDPATAWLGSDPLRDALHTLLPPNGNWTGDATELLNRLRAVAPHAALPTTPKGLSQALPGVPGFRIERGRTYEGERALSITRIADTDHTAAAGHMYKS